MSDLRDALERLAERGRPAGGDAVVARAMAEAAVRDGARRRSSRPGASRALLASVAAVGLAAASAVVLTDDDPRSERVVAGPSPAASARGPEVASPAATATRQPGHEAVAPGRWRTVATAVPGDYRIDPDVVWTGEKVLVFYAATNESTLVDGELVDPRTGNVSRIDRGFLEWRAGHAAVWTGTELLVWGGSDGPGTGHRSGAYDPAANRWRPIADGPRDVSGAEQAVWTGHEMLVWGGGGAPGAAYRPATDSWRPTAPAPLTPRIRSTAVWTGSELVVWGGCDLRAPSCIDLPGGPDELADGAAYDPASDTWRTIASAPLAARDAPEAVWTGEEVVVWGGEAPAAGGAYGAAYDPAADTWRVIQAGPLRPRWSFSLVWTGAEMVVWGGATGDGEFLDDGAAYDPAADAWRTLPPAPPGVGARGWHGAAWFGDGMLLAGGRGANAVFERR